MKIYSSLLHEESQIALQQVTEGLAILLQLPAAQLSQQPAPGAWNALQCLEHLNRYCLFYLPQLSQELPKLPPAKKVFRSGIIGNMMVNTVKPGLKIRRMKTFKSMDPHIADAGPEALGHFRQHHQKLQELLQYAQHKDLSAGKIKVTFTSLINLNTGNALRFMVYHNQRHMQQALRAAGIK